mmetsp:Transcript_72630/g.151679  ORF Transcript_72630/g.151679 Transcript_72630/m.151679 type:complete len:191 (+) Transcript_72630:56-628(+)
MPGQLEESEGLGHNQRVLKLQEDRVRAYEDFEAAIRAFIDGGTEEEYERACRDITARFKVASDQINAVNDDLLTLATAAAKGLSGWIRKLQDAEKDKLYLTVASHIERKRLAKMKLAAELVAKNAAEQGTHVCGHAHTHESEGTTADQELNDLALEVHGEQVDTMHKDINIMIEKINEILDEIRYWEDEE